MYFVIRRIWYFGIRAFFRRIEVEGKANIPAEGGVLFIGNHLNAFVDGILLLTHLEQPLRVTAKATLRKNPVFQVLLRAIRAVTFHRVEDGESQAGNSSALAEVVQALQDRERVLIFPEGHSHSDGILRPFKKGAAKVALEVAAENPHFHVVPVGLVYLEKDRFRSDVLLRFGEAIPSEEIRRFTSVEDLNSLFRERVAEQCIELDPKTLREYTWVAKALLADEHVPARLGEEPHPLSPLLKEVGLIRHFQIHASEDLFAKARNEALRLHSLCGQGGIRPEELSLPLTHWRAFVFLLRELEIIALSFLPGVWGLINLAPAYLLTRALVRKTAKDEDHRATHAIFLGTPIFCILAAAQALVVGMVASWGAAVLYLLTLPFFVVVTLLSFDRLYEARKRVRSFFSLLRMKDERMEIYQLAESLRRFTKNLR